ncbi:MAG: 3-oxoacyl-ACP synthase III family protein [Bacteroidia bacterium]
MAQFVVTGSRLCGVAAAVPTAKQHNSDYNQITEQERNMLIKTTGIATRHIAPAGMATSDLCFHAAEKLIAELHWNKDEIDLLIFVSQSPDYFLPATSIVLQARLGLPKTTAAFDMSLGCSGYIYGLSTLTSMMASGGFRKALLLAGDISTAGITPNDKSTWPLFGDAGTASAFCYDPNAKTYINLQSDGTGFEAIIIPDGGLRNPISENTFVEEETDKGIVRHRRNLWLNGLDVFNFSIREAPPSITSVLNQAQRTQEETDFFIFHQANKLILETIRKKLKIPAEKVPYSLTQFGNTSSASIPLTMTTLGEEASGHKRWVLSGFGVGLSWGSALLETNQLLCLPILEIETP